MIELGDLLQAPEKPSPQVLRTVATRNEGIAEVIEQVEQRISALTDAQRHALRRRRALAELTAVVEERIREAVPEIADVVVHTEP